MSRFASSARKLLGPARSLQSDAVAGGCVVVTGASTGIGEAIATHLGARGYRVLAGVRKQRDYDRMAVRPGVEPVMLDVTSDEHIADLAKLVDRTAPEGLLALVNNAGVGAFGPVETIRRAQWEAVLSVNVIGVASVTRALLPSLIRRGGRVIGIGSGAGRLGFPLFAPYATSKFALEGFTDVLRREVARHGVRVVNVQPGIIATPIYDKSLPGVAEMRAGLPTEVAERYHSQLDSAISSAEEAGTSGKSPQAVAEVVQRAIEDRRARTRYQVGADAKGAVLIARLLPGRLLDVVVAQLTRK